MNGFEEEQEEKIEALINILEEVQMFNELIATKEAHYAITNRKSDTLVEQYTEGKKRQEKGLYILLIQLNAPSAAFEMQFKTVVDKIADNQQEAESWFRDIQPYLDKVGGLMVHI